MGWFRKKAKPEPEPIEPRRSPWQCAMCMEDFRDNHNLHLHLSTHHLQPRHPPSPPNPTKPQSGILIPQHLIDKATEARRRAAAQGASPGRVARMNRSSSGTFAPMPKARTPLVPAEEIVDDLRDLLGELDDDPTT